MIIGKMGSITQVGIFSRGLGLVEFLSQSLMMGVNPVALPYLSETKRTGGSLPFAYTKACVLLGGLVWPVLAVASLASLPVIRLFFGDQWDAAAPLAAWLAIWGMFRSTHWFSNSVLLANGKEKAMVVKEALVFSAYFSGIIIAMPYGLDAVAFAFVIASVWDILLTSVVLKNLIGLSIMTFIKGWLPNFAVTATCWGATFLISNMISFESNEYWLPILIIAAVLPLVWFLSLKVFNHPLYDELINLLKGILSKKSQA